ncbi:MAG: hypothetical protein COV69_01730 [Parcubacteria group bacterium CG11_big_fil_rev_8_21_14_0_20_39_14]|nr:MAG: hypothetical protein COV69_01730 [Parcubacteria group bacterium CG11_big_fil_rev_8_21_14_0_20_39_14]
MDIIIKNAQVIDGTGKEMFQADLGIEKDKIKAIGSLQNKKAKLLIDGAGLYLAPGFIDILNHSDAFLTLFLMPEAQSLIFQGITTVLCGNCGSSLAPIAGEEAIRSVQKWGDVSKININWRNMNDFLEVVDRIKFGVNFATLVGHSTLRRGLVGDAYRSLMAKEMEDMKILLEQALKQGAFGLSFGLAYSHAKIASQDELIELAKVLNKYQGICSIHLRNESEEILSSINEALNIGNYAQTSLEISHFKILGENFWLKWAKAIQLLEESSKGRLNVNFDIYPYKAASVVFHLFLPDWVKKGGKNAMLKRLKDQEIKEKVIGELKKSQLALGDFIISISPLGRAVVGKNISEIASSQESSVEKTAVDLLVASDGHLIVFAPAISSGNLKQGIIHPLSFISSDGAGYDLDYGKNTSELIHPRSFGALPRFLRRYVKEERLFTWEKAIKKITSAPAEKLGLKNRGKIKEGFFADLVLFDPETISDKATFTNPYQFSEGIEYVFVNGEMAIRGKKLTKIRAGRALRRK